MENRKKYKAFILPILAASFLIINYSRLSGTENVRPIHVVSLIGLGIVLGVLLRNVIAYFRGNL